MIKKKKFEIEKFFREEEIKLKKSEIIGFSGNTGSLTSGPHLHFELWFEGEPVDPLSFIEF